MLVKQLAVFMENKPGRLHKLTKTLGENGVDFITLSIADTKEYGIVRFVASDTEKAYELVKSAGFAVELAELIGIEVEDVPNALAKVIELLSEKEINIEYLYSFAYTANGSAKILLRVDDTEKTLTLFKQSGIKILAETLI